jgi:hypothetical protein
VKLEPVQNYKGARYPNLADYLKRRKRNQKLSGLTIIVALALLNALLAGCAPSDAS